MKVTAHRGMPAYFTIDVRPSLQFELLKCSNDSYVLRFQGGSVPRLTGKEIAGLSKAFASIAYELDGNEGALIADTDEWPKPKPGMPPMDALADDYGPHPPLREYLGNSPVQETWRNAWNERQD